MNRMNRLTDAELELMLVLWDRGGATAREVHTTLDDERAYTTVSTLLRILVDKGFARAEAQGRAHRYVPTVTREEVRGNKLTQLMHNLFGGSALQLVRQLAAQEDLADDEVDALRRLVDELPDDGAP